MDINDPKNIKVFNSFPKWMQKLITDQHNRRDCRGLCLRQITPHDPCPQCTRHIDALIAELISQCNAQIDDLNSTQLWRELNCPGDLRDVSYSEFYRLIS